MGNSVLFWDFLLGATEIYFFDSSVKLLTVIDISTNGITDIKSFSLINSNHVYGNIKLLFKSFNSKFYFIWDDSSTKLFLYEFPSMQNNGILEFKNASFYNSTSAYSSTDITS